MRRPAARRLPRRQRPAQAAGSSRSSGRGDRDHQRAEAGPGVRPGQGGVRTPPEDAGAEEGRCRQGREGGPRPRAEADRPGRLHAGRQARAAPETDQDDKQKAWKRLQEDAQNGPARRPERKEMQALENRVGPVIKDFFKERGYALIFNNSSRALYADDAVDMTDEVLKRVQYERRAAQAAQPTTRPRRRQAAAPAAKSAPAGPAPTKKPLGVSSPRRTRIEALVARSPGPRRAEYPAA